MPTVKIVGRKELDAYLSRTPPDYAHAASFFGVPEEWLYFEVSKGGANDLAYDPEEWAALVANIEAKAKKAADRKAQRVAMKSMAGSVVGFGPANVQAVSTSGHGSTVQEKGDDMTKLKARQDSTADMATADAVLAEVKSQVSGVGGSISVKVRATDIVDTPDDLVAQILAKENGGNVARETVPAQPKEAKYFGVPITREKSNIEMPEGYVEHPCFDAVGAAIASGLSVGLRGPAGTGKTTLVQWFAHKTGNILVQQCCGEISAPEDIHSKTGLKDGNTVLQIGPLIYAMTTGGGLWYCIDEAASMTVECINTYFPCCDGTNPAGRHILVNGERIYAKPDFRFFATFNPLEYEGNREMNMAFRDRLCILDVDYLPEKSEAKLLLMKVPNLPKDIATRMVKCANDIRDAKKSNAGVTLDMTPRRLVVWAKMACALQGEAGERLAKAFTHAVVSQLDRSAVLEREALVKYYNGRFADIANAAVKQEGGK